MALVYEGKNLLYDCLTYDASGDLGQGVLAFDFSLDGLLLNLFINADALEFAFELQGELLAGISATGDFDFGIALEFDSTDLLLERFKDSWVKWSAIGSADFTIGRDNIAGEMPMAWPGVVHDVRKLEGKVMVYGANGVSMLTPAENTFGMRTIYTLGIKSRHAVVGTDNVHYFIDTIGQLWKISDGLEKLDYSEFLSLLSFPVMSWDNEKNLIYICDGTLGFVYSPDSNSLASGPVNVAGIAFQDATSYITAPADIDIPRFEMTTDIYDFNTRKEKTIFGLEVSTDLSGALQATIEYRTSHTGPFTTLPWQTVTPLGEVTLPCYGVEFRFKFRTLAYEYFELDWIKIIGVIAGYSHLDFQG
jgi:hypothetical protein